MLRWFSKPLSVRQMRLLCASLLAGFALCGALQGLCWGRTQLDAGAALCADTLRLHIRAASDAVADQSAKLRVRDAVLAVMQQCPAHSAPEARAWAAGQLLQFQLAAQRALAAQGIRTPVRVYLVNMYFPARRYPTGQLPAGRYDAVRLDIGTRRAGRNWWCVLYPGLCRSACGTYALPEENDLVCGGYVVRFKCVEWWQRVTASREDQVLVETASPSQARSKDGEGKNAMAHLPTALHTLSWKECDHNGDPRLLFVDPKGLLRPGRSPGADLAERRA